MPEGECAAGLGEYPRGDGLADHRQQGVAGPPGNRGQVVYRERRPEQRRDAQRGHGVGGQEVQPGLDRRGQAHGYPVDRAEQFGDVPADRDPAVAGQRGDQFGGVQRVTGRLGDGGAQRGPGPAAGDPFDQAGHVAGGQRTDRYDGRAPADQAAPEPFHPPGAVGGPAGRRSGGADQQQRDLADGEAEPVPGEQAGLVGPVQVVEREQYRRPGGHLVDVAEQLLDRHGHRVGAAVRGGDGGSVGAPAGAVAVDRPRPRSSAPMCAASSSPNASSRARSGSRCPSSSPTARNGTATGRPGPGDRGLQQRGLADAGFAFEPDDPAAAVGERGHGGADGGELVVPPDRWRSTRRRRHAPILRAAHQPKRP